MKARTPLLMGPLFMVLLGRVFFIGPPAYAKHPVDPGNTIKVFVSILPQVYFVKRVGGERVDIAVMVGPGHSPATYEPVPKQMAELSKAKLYFRIGVPFENAWMHRLSKANPNMKVIDTQRGIELLAMKTHPHGHHAGAHIHGKGLKDPHVWLSLRRVKVLSKNIYDALVSEDPAHKSFYADNLNAFHHDLDKMDKGIAEILRDLRTRKFMTFHPAWGYFARDYGLEQVPVEIEGKEPTARALGYLIEQAKKEEIRVVFVQKQFSKKSAEAVAWSIGGKVIQIDPLAADYLANMGEIAQAFSKVMQ
ncbi:MAG: zinc ABC transporter substrate-binding protein [Desulfobacterales bacterium]|nr:MAG: zinc ABC transporter substrate-binding protein [Desulfobacterales bacterium]